MPSSGKEIATIMSDAGFINNKEGRQDFDACVNKIGNKILLEENINKSIGNKWFRTKKSTSVKNKTGYKDSIYAIAKSLSNYNKDVWEVEDIVEATNKAADRIATFIIGS